MADQEYHLVFRGTVVADMPVAAVKTNLAKIFNADAARIEPLFSGRLVILKKGLGREESERYRLLFEKAGAVCEVVPAGRGSAAPSAAEHAVPVDAGKPPATRAAGSAGNTEPGAAGQKSGSVNADDGRPSTDSPPGSGMDSGRREMSNPLAAFLKNALASIASGRPQSGAPGTQRRPYVWTGAALAAGGLILIVLMLSGGARPMPIEAKVFNKFAKQYYREIRETDLANAATQVLIERAHEVVEDMGFDFDQTLLLWLLNKDLVESRGGRDIYRAILVEPVAVAVSAGLSGIEGQIAPETRRVFETAAAIPAGVDLAAIRMIRACPGEGNRLDHDDLVRLLEDHNVPVDPGQPDLSIADAFFGLEQAGLIDIHRRWENDTQFSDIVILAPEALRQVEAQLDYLAVVKQQTEHP